jgi:hypothetical protein
MPKSVLRVILRADALAYRISDDTREKKTLLMLMGTLLGASLSARAQMVDIGYSEPC